jgi:conjugal transfer pilus assembly protein TraA
MRKTFLPKLGVTLAALLPMAAFASNNSSDPFSEFATTVVGWAQGPLGTGLAVTMMLIGAGLGVARNSPMPALSGIAGAAFLNWGPGIIQSLTNGALI